MKSNIITWCLAPLTQPAGDYFIELMFSVLITLKPSSQHITLKSKELTNPVEIFTCQFARTNHFS
jgi:hypothetical protein